MESILDQSIVLKPLIKVSEKDLIEPVRYSYRSFDRQWLIPDNRLVDYLHPHLWYARSEKKIYLTSLLTKPLGIGSAMTVCAAIPDLDHFSNRGAKDIIPLFLYNKAAKPNIPQELLELLNTNAEDFAGYVYCVLAHPEYTSRFSSELVNREVRVPITKNKKLFSEAAEFGKFLIWLQTYGERLDNAKDRPKGKIPKGSAKNTVAVSDREDKYPKDYSYNEPTKTILVGDGKFAPVAREIWEFEVSGFKVVQSWLGYLMRERKGKKSCPLDDIHPKSWTYEFTREFKKFPQHSKHSVPHLIVRCRT